MATLLTGGAGYIGSHCFYAFEEAGIELVVLDDLSTGNRSALPDNTAFYEGNAGDSEMLAMIFETHDIDTVVHFAGSIIVSESVENPTKYFENNTSVTLQLLKACVKHNVKNLIFSSTASIYGNNAKQIMTENEPAAPENPYATSKLLSEYMIKDFHSSHGLNFVILRYFNVAGADPKGRTGQVVENATHLIKVACETALGKRDKIAIFGTDYDTKDGTTIRDYIHVSDLATAHLSAYQYLQDQTTCAETFNCGYGTGYTVNEVLNTLETISGKTLNKVNADRRPGDVMALVADAAKLRSHTNWVPKHDDLTEIVSSALNWESKQG